MAAGYPQSFVRNFERTSALGPTVNEVTTNVVVEHLNDVEHLIMQAAPAGKVEGGPKAEDTCSEGGKWVCPRAPGASKQTGAWL